MTARAERLAIDVLSEAVVSPEPRVKVNFEALVLL